MAKRPTYEELEQKVMRLEEDAVEHKRMEEAKEQSELQYRELYENAPNTYFSVRAEDGSILRCNSAALRLLGYDKKTFIGMKVFDLYADTPDGKSKAHRIFKRFRAGESIRDVELQMKRRNGDPVWISLSIEPARDDAGSIVESRSVVIDISERKQAEEALREKQVSDSESFGLMGMRERALSVGGEVNIRGIQNEGTAVKVKIPTKK